MASTASCCRAPITDQCPVSEPPKVMVPRQISETNRPVRPSCLYFICAHLPLLRPYDQPAGRGPVASALDVVEAPGILMDGRPWAAARAGETPGAASPKPAAATCAVGASVRAWTARSG